MDARTTDLHAFLHPRTAAVIGVSERPDAPGVSLFRKLRERLESEGGRVFPVHPTALEIEGLPCFARVSEIPHEIDLAVILIADAEAALRDCVVKGCRFVVVFTAGFAETGPAGAAREAALLDIARRGGVRLFGPNTNANAFEKLRDLPGPRIGLVTQSGNQGRPLMQAQELGVGFSAWIPTGNEADLEAAEFIEHFARDPGTAVIAGYVEGFRDAGRLRLAADAAMHAGKPIVLVKVGRSAAGQRMAQAHTGHLAGSDRVVDAFFRQWGITRAVDLEELLDVSAMFARLSEFPRDLPDGACVYGMSGGSGALMSDLLGVEGVPLPELAPATQARLRSLLPDYLTIRNPVDNGGASLRGGAGREILAAIAADPEVGVVVAPIAGAVPPLTTILARELIELHRGGRVPCVVVWASPLTDDEAHRLLLEARLPMFRSFRGAARGIRAWREWRRLRASWESPLDAVPGARRVAARGPGPVARTLAPSIRGVAGASGALSEADSKRLLADYGIPITREELVRSQPEVRAAARRIGFPLAAKICSPDIPHKSEFELIRLGLHTVEEAETAVHELTMRARRTNPAARVDGVLLQEMVAGGVEMILGVTRDAQMGPVVLCGLGGVLAEALDDVALRPVPLTRHDAASMIEELRGRRLLRGFRGRPVADEPALIDALVRLGRLAFEQRDSIVELDVNPFVVLPAGRGARALDALVVLQRTA